MGRIAFRDLHGLVLLDKPLGLSSNQALQAARRLFRAAKGGHTGALDPLATGLLPLCFGEGTKIAGQLLGSRKAYLAECRLGTTTTTADLEGEVIAERAVPELSDTLIEAALQPFRGRIAQVPPVYSAIKQGGEALYLKARRGETVEVPAREVEIHRLELVAREGNRLVLRVECGSGTYIRSLAVDIGEALGCGAHLCSLRRLWVEPFLEPQMVTLEQIEQAAGQGDTRLLALMRPVGEGLAHLPAVPLDAVASQALSRGQRVQLDPSVAPVGRCAAYGDDGALLALAECDAQGWLRVLRGFNLPPPLPLIEAGRPPS
ncbi:tRNA pseudouridine(55) synthase TruB [Dyella sp.]|jgi:tRNA pseudouridine55 synthase|uniref:tRNA pseudouridine(55) synthase TruB n=1 Tax=Dyella sp. TaxID=1869338 RepID=UPI002D7A3B5B|nr:tRNA pseudouridine(55) synthase TruB [Dyella sp.]HET6433958.1 tRNA pseudouridine(55) synthase TruB [Dyella sp.]